MCELRVGIAGVLRLEHRLPLRTDLAVAARRTLCDQPTQEGHLAQGNPALLGARIRRERRRDETKIERALAPQTRRRLDHARIAGEPTRLLGTRSQVRGAAARNPPVEIVEAAPSAHRGERGGEMSTIGGRIVDVVGGDRRDADLGREFGQRVGAVGVERIVVIPQLDGDVIEAEPLDEATQLAFRRSRPVRHERRRNCALATSGQDEVLS